MAEFIIEMVRRILKGSLVAVGTFLAGAPVVYLCASWTHPEVIQASVDSQMRRLDAELQLVRAVADRRSAYAMLEGVVGTTLRGVAQ